MRRAQNRRGGVTGEGDIVTVKSLAENDIVLIRATVREAFPEEACVRLAVGTKGLTQSVWVARTAIIQVVPKQADPTTGREGDGRSS